MSPHYKILITFLIGTTFLFLSIWILDPSVLTTFSILGLTATISDYIVPTVTATMFKSDSWDSVKERAYDEFCRAVVVYKAKIALSCASFYVKRTSRPRLVSILFSLLFNLIQM